MHIAVFVEEIEIIEKQTNDFRSFIWSCCELVTETVIYDTLHE